MRIVIDTGNPGIGQFDVNADVNETASIVYGAKKSGGKSAILIIGGGSPKNFVLQTEPQIQEVLYRAMEKNPRNRYHSARDFAHDLEHLDQVGVEDRPELTEWKRRKSPLARRIALYALLALIPVIIFGLLLFVARHS